MQGTRYSISFPPVSNFPNKFIRNWGHNHTNSPLSLKTFSPDDILTFARLVGYDKVVSKEHFVYTVVVEGATYAIVIEDLTKFNAFFTNHFSDELSVNILHGILNTATNKNFDQEQTERSMLTFFKSNNTGISMLKAQDNNLGTWEKLSLNSSDEKIVTNCN